MCCVRFESKHDKSFMALIHHLHTKELRQRAAFYPNDCTNFSEVISNHRYLDLHLFLVWEFRFLHLHLAFCKVML